MNYTIIIYKVEDRPVPIQPDLLHAPKAPRKHLFTVETGTVGDDKARETVKHLTTGFPRSNGFEIEVIRWLSNGTYLDPLSFINESKS